MLEKKITLKFDKEDQPLYTLITRMSALNALYLKDQSKHVYSVINQHVKTAKSHLKHHKNHQSEIAQGVADIRSYFQVLSSMHTNNN